MKTFRWRSMARFKRLACGMGCAAALLFGATDQATAVTFDWGKIVEIVEAVVPPGVLPGDALGHAAGAAEAAGSAAVPGAKGKCSSVSYASAMTAGVGNLFEEFEFTDFGCRCTQLCVFPPADPVLLPAVGIPGTMKFWQGDSIIEVVRQPRCSPVGGTVVDTIPDIFGPPSESVGGRDGFYHVHAIPNAVLFAAAAVMEVACHFPAQFDSIPIYMSEIDPLWNPAMGPFFPEPFSPDFAPALAGVSWKDFLVGDALVWAKKYAWAANQEIAGGVQIGESLLCVAECVAMTVGADPFSFPPFSNCSACQGVLAPYTGALTAMGGRRGAELLVHRYVKLMMSSARWQSTTFEKCAGGVPLPGGLTFPKNEFRLQSIYPAEESQMRKFGAMHVPVVDELGKQGPFLQQDYVFQLWKRRECCATAATKIPGFCNPLPVPYLF